MAKQTAAERAADRVWEVLCPDGDGYAAGDGPTVEEVISALMADPGLLREMADEAARRLLIETAVEALLDKFNREAPDA